MKTLREILGHFYNMARNQGHLWGKDTKGWKDMTINGLLQEISKLLKAKLGLTDKDLRKLQDD